MIHAMKKKQMLFVLGISLVSFLGCNSQTDRSAGTSSADIPPSQTSAVNLEAGAEVATAPIHITKADFLAQVMNYEKNMEAWVYEGELPCIVDFYATWCPPCKISDPILEELAKDYAGKIRIYKVDVDQEEELAAVFGIQSIPTFLFCPMEGNPTISSGIAQTPEDTEVMFRQQIEELLFPGELSGL